MLDWKEPTLPSSTRVVHWFIFKRLVLVGKFGFEKGKTLNTSGGAHREEIWKGVFFATQVRGVFTQNSYHTLQPRSRDPNMVLGEKPHLKGKVQPNQQQGTDPKMLNFCKSWESQWEWEIFVSERHCVISAPISSQKCSYREGVQPQL